MPTFVPPTTDDVPSIDVGGSAPPAAYALMRHFGPRTRGRTVVKSGGTYTTYDTPEQSTLDAADIIAWPDGTKRPAIYLGGHEYEVTASEAAALTAAGYVVT